MTRLSIIAVLMVSLLGCTTTKIVEKRITVTVELKRPERPSFTKIMNDDVSCLSENTQKLFIKRDQEMKLYMGELENLIDSNNYSAKLNKEEIK